MLSGDAGAFDLGIALLNCDAIGQKNLFEKAFLRDVTSMDVISFDATGSGWWLIPLQALEVLKLLENCKGLLQLGGNGLLVLGGTF